MHKISYYNELTAAADGGEPFQTGLIVDIKPPVNIGEAALQRYISEGKFTGDLTTDIHLAKPLLIGSSAEQTSFFYPIDTDAQLAEEQEHVLARTEEFLGYLGVNVEIVD